MQVHVVPMEKGDVAGTEGRGSGDAIEGEEPPRKRAKVMLLQVMRKGITSLLIILCCEIVLLSVIF